MSSSKPAIPAVAAVAAQSTSAPQLPPAPLPSRIPKRPKNRPPSVARFIIDELRGDAGFVSEDIWRDVFGFRKKVFAQDRKLEDIDLNGSPPQGAPVGCRLTLVQRSPKTNRCRPPYTSQSPPSPLLRASENGPSSPSP